MFERSFFLSLDRRILRKGQVCNRYHRPPSENDGSYCKLFKSNIRRFSLSKYHFFQEYVNPLHIVKFSKYA